MSTPAPLYIGIGIGTYEDGTFPALPRAVPDVSSLGQYLADCRGFAVHMLADLPEATLRARLKGLLPSHGVSAGSALVLLWSGHGLATVGDRLHLIARDTKSGSAPDLTPGWVAELASRSGATRVLLLLDTCFAGRALAETQHLVDQIQQGLSAETWFGVLASAQAFERARDGAFMAHLLTLLRKGPSDPALRRRWSAYNSGILGSDVMHALVKEWPHDSDQRPKQAQVGTEFEPLFPNPEFDEDAIPQVVEHLLLASEGRAPDEEGVYFTGREAELDEVVAWMRECPQRTAGVMVITGPPGCGKSAIAGRLVSLSDPVQRKRLLALGPIAHADPGEGTVQAHVHLRGLTVEQVVEHLDAAFVRCGILEPGRGGGARSRAELINALARVGRRPVVVLDGLDEARENAWAIAGELVVPLAATACILVTSRQVKREAGPSLLQALSASVTLDLGQPERAKRAGGELRTYVVRRLAGLDAPRQDAGAVAEEIVRIAVDRDATRIDSGFLLARIVTSQLRAQPVDTTARNWQALLSRSVEQALERDLERVGDRERARDLLAALARSYGPGFPDDLWALVASAVSLHGRTYTREDVDAVALQLGRYIVEDGLGQRAVYRLSHQRLVDVLHPVRPPREFDAGLAEALPVATTLVAHYARLLDAGMPPRASTYLWRYAWRHCEAAGDAGADLLRPLAQRLPGEFRPDLAVALDRLGIRYSEVGRRAEAVGPTEQAVELYGGLAAEDPAFVPALAGALDSLGIRYSEVGRRAEAVGPTEEAVERYRELAAHNPAFVPDLAMALNNLGGCYSEIGLRVEAVGPAEEAVERYRALAAHNPAFVPDLAGALNNLGIRYSEVGRRAEAVGPAEEAVERYRALSAENAAFVPDLAGALNNVGTIYNALGMPAARLDAAWSQAVSVLSAPTMRQRLLALRKP